MKKLLMFTVFAFLAAPMALAAEATEAAAETAATGNVPYGAIAAAAMLMIAAAFGALAQSKAIVAACEGTARNPGATGSIRMTMIIGLALIESLVLYAFIFAFVIRSM